MSSRVMRSRLAELWNNVLLAPYLTPPSWLFAHPPILDLTPDLDQSLDRFNDKKRRLGLDRGGT